jgi:hypothetical protein
MARRAAGRLRERLQRSETKGFGRGGPVEEEVSQAAQRRAQRVLWRPGISMSRLSVILDGKMPAPGDFPASFAFSIHKAGSSLMFGMIQVVCEVEGIPTISLPDILFQEGIRDADWNEDTSLTKYLSAGRLYIGFRYFPGLMMDKSLALHEKKSVLLVRDPRDALVSQYFSFSGDYFSHPIPKTSGEGFVAENARYAGIGIDGYVVRVAVEHKAKLLAYLANLNPGLTRVFRYEEAYFDKESFLRGIFDYFCLSAGDDAIRTAVAMFDIRPAEEDVEAHIRKGSPGDHKEKLQPETIEWLTEYFDDVCAALGYDLRRDAA